MDPFTIALLASAGMQLMGGAQDMASASSQAKLDKKAAELTALGQETQVIGEYTNIFEKQISDLSTQKAVFANLGVDKAGTLYSEGLRAHEKAFLKAGRKQEEDIKAIEFGADISKTQAGIRKSQTQQRILTGTGLSLANLGATYYGGKR